MRPNKKQVDLYLSFKRRRKAWKKKIRQLRRHQSRVRAAYFRVEKAGVFGSTSLVARMLGHRSTESFPLVSTSLNIEAPSSFSMHEAPGEVLNFISRFAKTHLENEIQEIFIDFSTIERQDLGAHALLDVLVEEVKRQATFHRKHLRWRGRYPKGQEERRFLRSMGIIRTLDLKHHFLSAHDASMIIRFERRRRHYYGAGIRFNDPLDKSQQSNAAQRFAEHVNRCLRKEGRELTPLARMHLCDFVVEIIDNAENHAGMIDWTIQGYIDLASDQPHCEIVIFNFGKSISESLGAVRRDGYTWRQISEYLELHSKSGWFGKNWRTEDLLTLIALQSSVSSLNQSIASTRGQGTADLIEFFQKMHDERKLDAGKTAHMYIVSGSTKVLIDGRYRIHRDDSNRRTIAFNEGNDLRKPPDPSCVMPLKGGSLPGTIIGIKFLVQADNLQTVVEDPS